MKRLLVSLWNFIVCSRSQAGKTKRIRLSSAGLLIGVSILASDCGSVFQYVPNGGTLLAKEGKYRIWEGSEGFFVTTTWPLPEPPDEVCIFETRVAAEHYYLKLLAGRRAWAGSCVCGREGRLHSRDYRYGWDLASNEDCEEWLRAEDSRSKLCKSKIGRRRQLFTAHTKVSEIGNWSVYQDPSGPTTDEVSCTGIYKGDSRIQLGEKKLFVLVSGALSNVQIRFDDGPARRLRVPTEIEKATGTVEIGFWEFKLLLAADRLRIQVLTTEGEIVNEDLDLVGIREAHANILSGCPTRP